MKLWEPYDIPIVCIAGEHGSGKTLWGLTVDPSCLTFSGPPTTYIWDTEGSSAPYVGTLNFTRMDMPQLLFQKQKDSAEDMFLLWKKDMMAIQPGQYRVLIIDTVVEIEEGLVRYIRKRPEEYGYSENQFAKMEGLMWGVMKSEWKRLLVLASQKCETLVLTTHMRDEFRGNQPTNRRIPKGKETIIQVASIYMTIARKMQAGVGKVKARPSGICAWPGGKVRLLRINPQTLEPEPLLPPHVVDASPEGIRAYFQSPANFNKLKPEERAVPPVSLSEDERLMIQADIAADQSAKAKAELGKLEAERGGQNSGQKGIESASEIKKRLLAEMTLPEAKNLLQIRYKKQAVARLTLSQLADLSLHLDSLGK